MSAPVEDVAIVGGGPAGLMMALLLARRGHHVAVYERRSDPRIAPPEAGRSINLALAARGLAALEATGLRATVDDLLMPMRGRSVHELGVGEARLLPYGQRPGEVIHAISRATLALRLTEAAACERRIRLLFDSRCVGLDADDRPLIEDAAGRTHALQAPRCIAADGAGSAVRTALATAGRLQEREEPLDHDYQEYVIPAVQGRPPLAPDALHIWPRGGFMLIALPNCDGSFTATLFLPRRGETSFESLQAHCAATRFFEAWFPDVVPLVPDLEQQHARHPQSRLGTVYASPWNIGEKLLLIGDAAHAIVPFHGQGMNCAFEDCRLLDGLLVSDPAQAFSRFAAERPQDTDAIALMALENYGEMRDAVREPRFALQKQLSLELERRHPTRFVPRYSMVMFRPDIPYHVALERGRVQQRMLDELTAQARSMDEVDLALAARLVEQGLAPLPAA